MTDNERFPVIVVGASAGGVFALETLLSGLPEHFPAAVLVALHTNPYRTSKVPEVLARCTALPVSHPRDGEHIRAGHIYIAPPNLHMTVDAACIHLDSTRREQNQRPAVDPLFRTAAAAFGPRVIGVVLTGGGADGSLGVRAIKAHGGRTVAQSPTDASIGFMPANAVATRCIDHCVPLEELPAALLDLCRGRAPAVSAPVSASGCRVLVVEDEYILAAEIEHMLMALGHRVLGPVSGVDEAFAILGSGEPRVDCALLDVNLGGEQVYPLAAVIRSAGVPLVFATGYGQEALPPEWRSAARVQKPFAATDLRCALAEVRTLPRSRHRAEARDIPVAAPEEEMRRARNQRMVSRARLVMPRS